MCPPYLLSIGQRGATITASVNGRHLTTGEREDARAGFRSITVRAG